MFSDFKFGFEVLEVTCYLLLDLFFCLFGQKLTSRKDTFLSLQAIEENHASARVQQGANFIFELRFILFDFADGGQESNGVHANLFVEDVEVHEEELAAAKTFGIRGFLVLDVAHEFVDSFFVLAFAES